MKKLFTTLGIILTVAGTSLTMATNTPPAGGNTSSISNIPNEACIQYTTNGVVREVCDTVVITYHNDPYASYTCESITSSSVVIPIDDNGNGSTTFSCSAADDQIADTIVIHCGNGQTWTGTNRKTYSHECTYTGVHYGEEFHAYCVVNSQTPTNPSCEKDITAGYVVPNCGNGVIEAGEDCDYFGMVRGESRSIGYYLNDKTPLKRAYQYEDPKYSCRNCKIIEDYNYIYEPAECLYTDTPISVMNDEILPFWWRLWIKDADFTDSTTECHNWNNTNETLLWKPTMKCHFAVYNGKHKQGDGAIQEFVTDCFNNTFEEYENGVYKYFIDNHQTSADGASIDTVNAVTDHLSESEYGEYKLVLERVEYEYCANGGRHLGERYGAVCEVDFAVTKPYVMQISTFGVSPVGTNDGGLLRNYRDMQGNELLKKTDMADVIKTNENDYAIESNVGDKFEEFKNKYEKLAVNLKMNEFKINGRNLTQIFGNNITSVKKVPNKSIYFIEGDVTLEQETVKNYLTSAFTIIVDGDVEIMGDVLQYAMIVANHIKFTDALDEDYRCARGGQVVQGIFVALDEFDGGERLRNTDPEEEWCAWGGLHVKGVLIGDGIEDLMNAKRSQLNSWFNTSSPNENVVRRERRQKIIAGAAVLIEYSPSLWKTLPPGAEIFTESLEVYRR